MICRFFAPCFLSELGFLGLKDDIPETGREWTFFPENFCVLRAFVRNKFGLAQRHKEHEEKVQFPPVCGLEILSMKPNNPKIL